MNAPVYFDAEPQLMAIKIKNETFYNMLPSEFIFIKLPAPQKFPNQFLGFRRIFS